MTRRAGSALLFTCPRRPDGQELPESRRTPSPSSRRGGNTASTRFSNSLSSGEPTGKTRTGGAGANGHARWNSTHWSGLAPIPASRRDFRISMPAATSASTSRVLATSKGSPTRQLVPVAGPTREHRDHQGAGVPRNTNRTRWYRRLPTEKRHPDSVLEEVVVRPGTPLSPLAEGP